MVDDMTEEFYEYLIREEELTTKKMKMIDQDDEDFKEKMEEHLDKFVSYEVSGYDAQKYVNKFGVVEAIQMDIDTGYGFCLIYSDSKKKYVDNGAMYARLLYIILDEIVRDGYDDVYDMVKMQEDIIEDRKNEKIDYINQISQMIIGF
jgi:hypothetical protein